MIILLNRKSTLLLKVQIIKQSLTLKKPLLSYHIIYEREINMILFIVSCNRY